MLSKYTLSETPRSYFLFQLVGFFLFFLRKEKKPPKYFAKAFIAALSVLL